MSLAVLVKYLEQFKRLWHSLMIKQYTWRCFNKIKFSVKPSDTILNTLELLNALELDLRKGQKKGCKKEKRGKSS